MNKNEAFSRKLAREQRQFEIHCKKNYPRFEFLAKQEAGLTYLWKHYDGKCLRPLYSMRIHLRVRLFKGYDNAYIRTKLQILDMIAGDYDYEIVDFDTGIPRAEFDADDYFKIINENTDWIIKWYTKYLKKDKE